jgi:hypothetical protein
VTGGLSTSWDILQRRKAGGALGPRSGIAIFRRGLPPTRGSALNASPKRTRCRFHSPVSKKAWFSSCHHPERKCTPDERLEC